MRISPLFTRSAQAIALTLTFLTPTQAWAPSHRVKTPNGQVLLRQLADREILFAFVPNGAPTAEIPESPMWDPAMLRGLDSMETPKDLPLGESMELTRSEDHLFVYLDPVSRRPVLEVKQTGESGAASVYRLECTAVGGEKGATFQLQAPKADHLFGLGEHLPSELLGEIDGDLLGHLRYSGKDATADETDPKGVYGNAMVPLAGGAVGNALFPILHLVDDAGPDAVLFLDNPVDSRWDFRSTPWRVNVRRGTVQGALAWGKETQELRKTVQRWTGRSPVPPRKAFGMWVSEYGYENWDELEEKASSLAEAGFPVDGFVLDLQWFGGITEGSPDSRMGSLTFDTNAFPNPAQKIAELASRGLGLIAIEEAYISGNLPEYADLASKGYLVRSTSEPDQPQWIDESTWWGVGSMLDYTNPEAADYWNRTKRVPLQKLGLMGHWTDLGEPEMFRHITSSGKKKTTYETPLYYGDQEQMDANNLFAFRWAESIFRGYGDDGHEAGQRPFILGRTGTAGIQRFGVALWSGDIGANWESLRSHYRAQSHLMLSGLDYFGSDIGGFHRTAYQAGPGGYDELYTRWFAAGCLTDVPVRPHTMNLGNKHQTAPNLVGDRESNLANLQQRYRLIPYLYSAAYRTWTDGTPLIAPPIAVHQGQESLDVSGAHKWIGPDLFARLILKPQVESVEVTLPASFGWYDFESGERVSEKGGETLKVPAKRDGLLRTPLFARASALIPVGSDSSSKMDPEHLEVMVFPGEVEGLTTLVEDDGWSEAYRGGAIAQTEIRQSAWTGRYGQVTIGPRTGNLARRWTSPREITLRIASSAKSLRAVVDQHEVEARREGGFWVVTLPDRATEGPTVVNFR